LFYFNSGGYKGSCNWKSSRWNQYNKYVVDCWNSGGYYFLNFVELSMFLATNPLPWPWIDIFANLRGSQIPTSTITMESWVVMSRTRFSIPWTVVVAVVKS